MHKKSIYILVLLALVIQLAASGCGNETAEADRMVKDADVLRLSAVEKFRKSTAAMDNLIRGAAAGKALPVNQTKEITDGAVSDSRDALEQLGLRDDKLKDAGFQNVSDKYKEYLQLLRDSNDKLRETMRHATAIPILLGNEQYSLAGWDELKAQTIVTQVTGIQFDIEKLYNESETMRNQAEQLRQDDPEAFE